MITKQMIQKKIDNLTEEKLDQVYEIIEHLSNSENTAKKSRLMSKLQKISINISKDLSD